ncbi:amine oxidase family protein [Natrialba magadii ATCC 43099]|uniref:Amine oxidase n=1 Tax=Natrialba magadii (strain ATCC 43099 / DSM 3394 / CCM 3739 / CIP 104546 / IAM 13178 / JCM 8861 / NBRC 102185 / NCIMB 2190 / MS3) TaxID=547559 RepID=D3SYG2_NATMM|nr:NAD(P)/FAD-dependent oxidoreductase [Natrialba magadii]ADD06133.1 amine oxidase family protein [Natrialba magadii ATCC 43099]ELY30868.1 amine oxidase [Natrialba magadii ATCC 43099]
MQSTPRVLVVGGGLAGLVAARHLAGGGVTVSLLERRDTVGGRVRTIERDGFRFDRGFQVLFTAYPAVQRELDLEALDLRAFAPGATIARPGHRSTLSDPLREPRAALSTLLNPDITVGDKRRVLSLWRELRGREHDPDAVFAADRSEDTTIDQFLRDRGFSDRFRERFVAPFYGGITLDRSLSTSSRVFEYTFAALASGSTAVPAAGMGAIPAQLADRARAVGATIETGCEVETIEYRERDETVTVSLEDGDDDNNGDSDDSHESDDNHDGGTANRDVDAVIVAADPPTAQSLTGVSAIPTEGRASTTQYYRLSGRTTLNTGRRLLLNASDDGPVHVVPHSEVAPEYAPPDETLLSATYLGHREESDQELTDRTQAALESWYPERAVGELEPVHTERIEFAQFAQPPGVYERLPDVRDPEGPVYLAGDYTRWSSIQGAMESGRQAARAVLKDLSR